MGVIIVAVVVILTVVVVLRVVVAVVAIIVVVAVQRFGMGQGKADHSNRRQFRSRSSESWGEEQQKKNNMDHN